MKRHVGHSFLCLLKKCIVYKYILLFKNYNSLLTTLTYSFNNCIVPFGYPRMGSSGCFPCKPAAAVSRYPTYDACLVFQCFHNPPNCTMDCGIFNMHTDLHVCYCTRVYTDAVRESALIVDSGRKILAAPENQTCVSGVPV